ncbi:MAG: hypothetical protein JWP97_3784 [Labilithrix sp.]|nr:hypothetical protein [Labilithrix sp.]
MRNTLALFLAAISLAGCGADAPAPAAPAPASAPAAPRPRDGGTADDRDARSSADASDASDQSRTADAAATDAAAPRKPEGVSQEVFLRACLREPGDDRYCGCVWKELRKQASPAELEAGTFGQATLFSQFERTCGKLRAVRTAP